MYRTHYKHIFKENRVGEKCDTGANLKNSNSQRKNNVSNKISIQYWILIQSVK